MVWFGFTLYQCLLDCLLLALLFWRQWMWHKHQYYELNILWVECLSCKSNFSLFFLYVFRDIHPQTRVCNIAHVFDFYTDSVHSCWCFFIHFPHINFLYIRLYHNRNEGERKRESALGSEIKNRFFPLACVRWWLWLFRILYFLFCYFFVWRLFSEKRKVHYDCTLNWLQSRAQMGTVFIIPPCHCQYIQIVTLLKEIRIYCIFRTTSIICS